jgi:hypothetical protein
MVNWLNLWAGSRHTWWLIKPFGASMSLGLDTIDCTGTRQQLADFCLLRLHRQQTNEMNLATTRKLLQTITGATPRESYQELITQRLNTGGFKDKTDWIVSCIFSDSPELALRGLAADASDPRIRDAACKVILNRNIRGDVRAAAIETAAKAAKTPDKTVLLAFCDVLDDSTPSSQREHVPQLRKDYPFSDRALLQSVRPFFEKQLQQSANRTIGALARAQLMKAAKKDLGPDPVRWRKWCQSR